MNGLIGRKVGMMQFFDATGAQVPVTVLEAGPCVVVQRKTAASDGYDAVQVSFGTQKERRLGKAVAGHYKKTGQAPARVLREFRMEAGEDLKAGDAVKADMFEGVPFVDVTAMTKGKGFQGVVRRHHMGGGPQTHGHMSHRRIGAIGQRTWPARIQKNKRMPGHMGYLKVTTQNLKVVQVRPEDNAILVEGAVPGPQGGLVLIRKAIKKRAKAAS
jgi:large subunit ribosomal protein L3